MAPLSSSSLKQEEETKKDDDDIVVIFFVEKKMQKIRKEEEKGAYLQAPTSATTLKLLLLSHSYCHHVEAPLVGGTLEAHVDFVLLKLSLGWKVGSSCDGSECKRRWVGSGSAGSGR